MELFYNICGVIGIVFLIFAVYNLGYNTGVEFCINLVKNRFTELKKKAPKDV